jgi:hypothetical protein
MAMNFNRKKFGYGANPVLQRDLPRGSASLDFASIAAGATATLTIPCVGAAVGDDSNLSFVSAPPVGLLFTSWVSAVDVVSVRAQNFTASPIDAAAFTARVSVLKLY